MKKFYFVLAASAALLAASCAKEEKPFEEKTAPQVRLTTISVKATHEADQAVTPDSKTTLNTGDGSVAWAAGDMIKMVWNGGSGISDPLASGGTSATFTVEVGDGTKYAVYPSSVDAIYDGSTFSVTVPASQDGSFANAAIEVAEYPGGAPIEFKNLGGLLELVIDNASVESIRISSNDSTPLAGTAAVTFDAGLPVIGAITSPSTSITLDVSGAGTYYAAVLPGSLDAGIYVELLDSGDNLIGEKLTGNTLAVARRQIRKLGTIAASVISNKKFFKVGGSGDGSSWDSPLGVADLSTVLKGGSDATLFLAQGTYTLSAEITLSAHSFTIYGGYPSDASGSSLANRDISAETAISGGGAKRIFVLNNSNTRLKADGITFKEAYSTSSIGSALVFENHGGSSLNHCIIKDNKTITSSSANGGAVRAKGTISFSYCEFLRDSTKAAAGGAIAMIASGAPNVTLDHCTFTNNGAPSGYGGAILAFGGTLTAKNCTFSGGSAGGGGVLRASTTSGIAFTGSFTDCTFTGNFATNAKQNDADGALAGSGIGGAVFSLNGGSGKDITITADNCTFNDNVAHPSRAKLTSSSTLKGAGSIASIGHYADVRMKDCLFIGNHTGFAAFVVNENSLLYLDRCRLWECKAMNDATVVYNNDGVVAFHNCVLYNNADIKGQQTDHINCNFYNTENGHMLLSCCSFRNNTSTSILRGSDSTPDDNTVIINNIIANASATGGVFDTASKFTSHGHNIVTKKSNWSDPGVWAGSVASDLAYTATNSNPATNSTNHILKTTLPDGFTKATRTDVTTAIESFDTNNGTGVLSWLGADAVNVDVLKNPRGATEIMPGSYEGE